MEQKFKLIILYTLLMLITASLGITSLISNIYDGSTIYILIISLVIIIIFFTAIDIGNVKIKELLNNDIIRMLSIIFLILSIIYTISIFGILINNLFYIVTPLSITTSLIFIFIMLLSFNKRCININIFFILGMFSSIILLIFMFLFPQSNLMLKLNDIELSNIYLYSYSILIIDSIFYKFYLSNIKSKKSTKTLIYSLIFACLLLAFYTYLDLTITNIDYTHTPFKNILKYQLILPSISVYFDLLYLVIVFIVLSFKLIILCDNLRIFLKQKKTEKNIFLLYLVIFLFSNTILNAVKNETTYLYFLLKMLIICSISLSLLIGGIKIVKRIYRYTKR